MIKKKLQEIGEYAQKLDPDLYYKLLDKEYINARTKLTFETIDGYKVEQTWSNLKKGHKATIFGRNNSYTLENIEKYIEKNCNKYLYYKLLDKEFKGNDKKLTFKTKDGYKVEQTWNNIKSGYVVEIFGNYNSYTLENIEIYIEKNCNKDLYYKLLDKEYINAKTKLTFETIDGYKVEQTWDHIKQGNNVEIFGAYNSYALENIEKYIEKNCNKDLYYKLLDKEYINARTKLTFETIDGYKVEQTWTSIQLGNGVEIFGNGNRYTLENIEKYIEKNCNKNLYYKLLDKEFKGNDKKLTFETIDGYKVQQTWGNIRGGEQAYIVSTSNKYTIYNIKKYIEKNCNKNLYHELLDKEYKYTNQKLTFKTKEGYLVQQMWTNMERGKEPHIVSPHNEYSIDNIKKYIEKNSDKWYRNIYYELLDNKYKSKKQKLTFKTKEGYKVKTTWDSLRDHNVASIFFGNNPYTIENINKYCKIHNYPLKVLSIRENNTIIEFLNFNKNTHVVYKRNIRNEPGLSDWANYVKERANYTCEICRETESLMVAHHKDGYHWCKSRRVDKDNGVCLCDKCHIKFHKIYTNKNNTEAQFEEFKILYRTQTYI